MKSRKTTVSHSKAKKKSRKAPARAVRKARSAPKAQKKVARKPVKAQKKVVRTAAKAVKIRPKPARRKEKDAFEERVSSKKPAVQKLPDPRDVEKITAILADSRIRQMLIELGGENALAIVRNFYGNHSDEDMAKKLKLKISDVRATLNKLHNEGLVNYIREKDSETGWYSYSWSLNLMRMERWATSQSMVFAEMGDSNQYYFCPSCGESSVTNFESAAEGDFRCERCNKLLDFIDEKKLADLIAGKK